MARIVTAILPVSLAMLLPASGAAGDDPAAKAPKILLLEGDVERVHDPAVIRQQDAVYLFCTGVRPGGGILPIRISKDLRSWKLSGHVFDRLPSWATAEIPRARGAWAPDISFFNGKYHLYYSVSSFGSRNSAIGLATSRTLDPASPEYKWVDEGLVARSREETDDWNAIDPNLVIENEQSIWLAWGSFWSGIKMRRIDPATGKLSGSDATLHALSSRPRDPPIDGSVEAPTIIRRGDFWYLLASFDRCCRGAQSTYKIAAGRSRNITGPYTDRTGKPMMEGGGTILLEATTPGWRGPGHQAILREQDADYLFFHAYHGTTGRPHLQISTLAWEDGWPRAGALP